MKKAYYPLVGIIIVALVYTTVLGIGKSGITTVLNNDTESEVVTQAASCWISDTPGGPATTTVRESTSSTERMYWLSYTPGKTIHSLEFYVVFFGNGNPTITICTQQFSFPNGYSGTTTTPFAVPFWGGDPNIGDAQLIPMVDGKWMWGKLVDFSVTK